MKKKKYLDLYYRWIASGNIPTQGLCNFFGMPEGPDDPNVSDEYPEFLLMLPKRSQMIKNNGYWGTDLRFNEGRNHAFCELRQNIVLLMAAMNNEL